MWTAIFNNSERQIAYERFVSSHTSQLAWEHAMKTFKDSALELVCIIPGDHVPWSPSCRV